MVFLEAELFPGGFILPSDELIVSRFSSLSGCLNPKVKAFSPPVYIPFTGGFLFSRPACSHCSSRSRHSSTPCRVVLEKSVTWRRRRRWLTCARTCCCAARESLSALVSSTSKR